MTTLVAADFLKLKRRRGLWFTALLLPLGLAILATAFAATGVADLDGGQKFMHDVSDSLSLVCTVLAVLIGARIGSMETAAGTLRYQLLTGVPRERLYLAKIAVVVGACAAITAAAIVPTILGAWVVPIGASKVLSGHDIIRGLWEILLTSTVYGLISFGVGSMSGNTGPAIAISLVLALIGTNLVALLTLISHWFRHLVLNLGIDRITVRSAKHKDEISIPAAIIVTLAWPAAFLAAGWEKLRKLEA